MEVVEDAEAFGTRQIDADFLECFADRGRQEIGVAWFAAPAGKRDLPRPRVADAHRAVDEQDFEPFVAVVQDHGDRCRNHAGLNGNGGRPVVVQRAAYVVQRGYAETSSPPSTLITLPVIQSAPGCESATIAPPRSAGVVSR